MTASARQTRLNLPVAQVIRRSWNACQILAWTRRRCRLQYHQAFVAERERMARVMVRSEEKQLMQECSTWTEISSDQVDRDVSEFTDLLDSEVSEHDLHDFLASHSYFLNPLLRMYGYSPLYSKVKLGAQFEVDFAWFDTGSMGPEWRLVEIEAPNRRMLTKRGEPSAALNHALQQVRDWNTWLHGNLDYARKLLPFIEYPMSYVFIGRRKEIDVTSRRRLRRLLYENRMHAEIHTLDWLASAGASVKGLIKSDPVGRWPVPIRALTHHDLAEGLPKEALKWMEYSTRHGRMMGYFGQERLRDREFSYLTHEEWEFGDED